MYSRAVCRRLTDYRPMRALGPGPGAPAPYVRIGVGTASALCFIAVRSSRYGFASGLHHEEHLSWLLVVAPAGERREESAPALVACILT